MFSNMKEDTARKAILFERLRTLLYISAFKNVNIWVVLEKPEVKLGSPKIVNGVIDYLLNGTDREPFHKKYIGGVFFFRSNRQPFDMSEISAVSYRPINDLSDRFDKTREDIVNRVQHLSPNTGFSADSTGTEKHYYNVLSNILMKP